VLILSSGLWPETSSDLSGSVLAANSEAIAGATITITDSRIGNIKAISSNATGRYNLRGLPVGGHDTVRVEDGWAQKRCENLYLTLGETLNLNVDLQGTETIDRVSVTGYRCPSYFCHYRGNKALGTLL
jgi:hypothetical protein